MERTTRFLPWIALVAVWILWGSTYLGIRMAVESMPPLLMAGGVGVVASAPDEYSKTVLAVRGQTRFSRSGTAPCRPARTA